MASHVDAIAYDPGLHRLYAAGAFGVMSVLARDGDQWRLLDSIKTHFGAHTLTVDPQTHRVYVAYASLFVAPRLVVFDAVP